MPALLALGQQQRFLVCCSGFGFEPSVAPCDDDKEHICLSGKPVLEAIRPVHLLLPHRCPLKK